MLYSCSVVSYTWNGTRNCMGDCLLLNDIVHILEACAALDGDLAVVTSRYAKVGQVIRKPAFLHSFGDEASAANSTNNELGSHLFWVAWVVGFSQQPKSPRKNGRVIHYFSCWQPKLRHPISAALRLSIGMVADHLPDFRISCRHHTQVAIQSDACLHDVDDVLQDYAISGAHACPTPCHS